MPGALGKSGGGTSSGILKTTGLLGSSQHPGAAPAPTPSGGQGSNWWRQSSQVPPTPAALAPAAAPTPAAAPGPRYQMPAPGAQMPYRPGAPAASRTAGQMAQYGNEMMDPNSPLMKRMQEIMTGRIGEETGAAKRLAAFQGSQAGMGGGGSPELSAMLGDIDVAGMETGGRASADLMARMPQMAQPFLSSAMQGQLGASGQDLSAWMQQQQLGQQAQGMGMESFYRGRGLDLEQQRMQNDAMMNQLSMMFG